MIMIVSIARTCRNTTAFTVWQSFCPYCHYVSEFNLRGLLCLVAMTLMQAGCLNAYAQDRWFCYVLSFLLWLPGLWTEHYRKSCSCSQSCGTSRQQWQYHSTQAQVPHNPSTLKASGLLFTPSLGPYQCAAFCQQCAAPFFLKLRYSCWGKDEDNCSRGVMLPCFMLTVGRQWSLGAGVHWAALALCLDCREYCNLLKVAVLVSESNAEFEMLVYAEISFCMIKSTKGVKSWGKFHENDVTGRHRIIES